MNGDHLQVISSIDELIEDPAKAAMMTPETAKVLLIGLASIQPLLIQRALLGIHNRQGDDALLTVPEAAEQLKLSEYRVYELIRQGVLKSIRLGRSVRIKPNDLAAYVAQQGG